MTTRISPNDLDKFLSASGTAPPLADGAAAAIPPAVPDSPLAAISGAMQQGNSTISEINELIGNVVNLWDKIEGVVMRGAERKAARLGDTTVNNYDDIMAGRAVMRPGTPPPASYGATYIDAAAAPVPPPASPAVQDTTPPSTTALQPGPAPAPDGGMNIPATEQILESSAKVRGGHVVDWLLVTLGELQKHKPDATVGEIIGSIENKRVELAENVAVFLK